MKLGRSYCPNLITYVESGEAVMNMREILAQAMQHSSRGVYKIDAVIFGSDDYCADIGKH